MHSKQAYSDMVLTGNYICLFFVSFSTCLLIDRFHLLFYKSMEILIDIFSSPEPKAQVSFSEKNLSVVSRCRRRGCWRCRKLFTFSSTGPISTKVGTKHPWVKGIQICSNEGPLPFPKGR